MHTAPLFSPDGMTGAGRSAPRFDNAAMLADDRFDDGLVHNHNWAVASDLDVTASNRASCRPAFVGSMQADRHVPAQADDRFDDGLVHNHDWAVSGK